MAVPIINITVVFFCQDQATLDQNKTNKCGATASTVPRKIFDRRSDFVEVRRTSGAWGTCSPLSSASPTSSPSSSSSSWTRSPTTRWSLTSRADFSVAQNLAVAYFALYQWPTEVLSLTILTRVILTSSAKFWGSHQQRISWDRIQRVCHQSICW